jgi:hypothetical protein
MAEPEKDGTPKCDCCGFGTIKLNKLAINHPQVVAYYLICLQCDTDLKLLARRMQMLAFLGIVSQPMIVLDGFNAQPPRMEQPVLRGN